MQEEQEELPTHRTTKLQAGTQKAPKPMEQVIEKYEEALRIRKSEMIEMKLENFKKENWIIEDFLAQNDFRDMELIEINQNPERIKRKLEKDQRLLESAVEGETVWNEKTIEEEGSKWEQVRPLRSLREVVPNEILMDLQEKMNDLKKTQKNLKLAEKSIRDDQIKCYKLGVPIDPHELRTFRVKNT